MVNRTQNGELVALQVQTESRHLYHLPQGPANIMEGEVKECKSERMVRTM